MKQARCLRQSIPCIADSAVSPSVANCPVTRSSSALITPDGGVHAVVRFHAPRSTWPSSAPRPAPPTIHPRAPLVIVVGLSNPSHTPATRSGVTPQTTHRCCRSSYPSCPRPESTHGTYRRTDAAVPRSTISRIMSRVTKRHAGIERWWQRAPPAAPSRLCPSDLRFDR